MKIEALRGSSSAAMGDILALYRRAIPSSERKPDAAIRSMADSPTHQVLVAVEEERVAGFALVYTGETLSLLEYLAVDEHRRGCGVGGHLYRESRSASGSRPLLVEVEADRAGSEDIALRRRRIRFYRRLGCRSISALDYRLPLGTDPPPIILLVDRFDGNVLPKPLAARWLRELYVKVYGCAEDDPRIDRMLAPLPATISLS